MVKAGSLLYSVYVCLLISIMSAGLIFIFNFNLTLSSRQAVQSDLLDLCESCTAYYLSKTTHFTELGKARIDLFDNGLNCAFYKDKWGVYTRLTVKAFFKKDTVQKSLFVGERPDQNKLALFVCDWDEPLKISGVTNIKGNMKIPATGYKTVNILGNSQLNKPVLSGRITNSSQKLPESSLPELNTLTSNAITRSLSKLNREKLLFNGFAKAPLKIVLDKGEQLNNRSFKGNIHIVSSDTLYLDSSTQLEDVIVQAPKIVFKTNFTGRGQFFATSEIFLEEGVILTYPSSVTILPGASIQEKKMTLSKNAKVYGGIVMDAVNFDEKENNILLVEENAFVMGTVYCNGKLQLQGKVVGSVYAHKIQLVTKSGNYENVLLNTTIDALAVPNDFIGLPIFKQPETQTYGVIKAL